MHCPWKGTKKEAIESFITFADALRDEIDMICKPLSSFHSSTNDKHGDDNDNDNDNDNDELESMQVFETLAQKVFGIDSLYDEQLTVMKAVQTQQDTVRIEFCNILYVHIIASLFHHTIMFFLRIVSSNQFPINITDNQMLRIHSLTLLSFSSYSFHPREVENLSLTNFPLFFTVESLLSFHLSFP